VLTFEQMKELMEMVASSKLGGLEVRDAGFHFRVSGSGPLPDLASSAAPSASRPATEADAASAAAADSAPAAEPEPEGYILKSPIVGTFYTAPSPDAEPYVVVGDRVKKGQVVCIVEAMKLMNEIESDVDGEIVEIYPRNAQPVEFGEPLFGIRV